MTNANDPVFPCSHLDVEDENRDRIIRKYQVCLTKRELFSMAMQAAWIVALGPGNVRDAPTAEQFAGCAVQSADALIAALSPCYKDDG